MSKTAFLSITLFLATFIAIAQQILTGKVVKVADGDTVTILTDDFRQVRVRLYGIDCPESHQDFGAKAKQFTSDVCFGKNVRVKVIDIDRYGRTVGIVILPDEKILNHELLKFGLAWHYRYFDQSPDLMKLEEDARKKGIGLWSVKSPTPPWEFRKYQRR